MEESTARALESINRRFYDESASAFDRTRRSPWAGWHQVLDLCGPGRLDILRPAPPADGETDSERRRVVRVLDAGCGNARFAQLFDAWLHTTGHGVADAFDYYGVDESAALLDVARRSTSRLSCRTRLVHESLLDHRDRRASVRPPGAQARAPGRQLADMDVVVCFGVLHHIAGQKRRERLLSALVSLLRPGGLLVVSFWQFGDDPRFARRQLPFRLAHELCGVAIDEAELEPGDHLLRWGGSDESTLRARYCHYTRPEEARALFATTGIDPAFELRADGRGGGSNLYVGGVRAVFNPPTTGR